MWIAGVTATSGFVRRYDGTSWEPLVTLPDAYSYTGGALWAASSHEVWAGSGDVVHRFDGTKWSRIPFAGGEIHGLGGTAGDVWASATDGKLWSIHHWDGAAFKEVHRVAAPSLSGPIWSSGPKDVWFAGRPGLRFDGATFSTLPVESDASIHGVWGSGPDDVFLLVGLGGGGEVRHFDGKHATEALFVSPNLYSITGSAERGAWIVGDDGATLRYAPSRAPLPR